MKLTVLLCVLCVTSVSAAVEAQQRITLRLGETGLKEVFKEIHRQTGKTVLYNDDRLSLEQKVRTDFVDTELEEILNQVLRNRGMSYKFVDDYIVIVPQKLSSGPQVVEEITLTGKVTDMKGEGLPGVTVMIKSTTLGTATDFEGKYSLRTVPIKNLVLVFSMVGMKSKEVAVGDKKEINVKLEEEQSELDEVVVTGIFQRKASSFTGSAVSMTKEDLMKVSNQNLFQSLKNMDPSLMIFDNLDFGSDPNKLPDMQLRGSSAFPAGENGLDLKGNYMNNPNQPLFILDGFEASVEKIFDLDMNRVESVTILKDAAAKAIYGSKAANGVVVVETKKLSDGNLRITYTGDMELQFPDLSSYNLSNAAEKLEIELKNGMYEGDGPERNLDNWLNLQKQYNRRLNAVQSGINTDWISKPLRNAIGHKHNLSVEMGNQSLRLITDISYQNTQGVMKGSDRTKIEGNVSISYRHKNFNFRDILTVTAVNSTDSPYGQFSEYTQMNPYWTPYDQYGNLQKNAEIAVAENGSNRESDQQLFANPLYNARLSTRLTQEYIDVTNNFYTEWNIVQGIKATIRFGITKKENKADEYYPANHLKFANYSEEDFFRKGSYQRNEGTNKRLSGDFNINFSREFGGKHYVFANLGWNMSENTFEEDIFEAEGFPSDRMDNIMFALQYAKDSKPRGSEATTRDVGYLIVGNYAYDNRYLLDVSLRGNGSSQFGENNRWGQFWSVGFGWNAHNETFLKEYENLQQLKFRGSVGYTGSQDFGAYQAMATYKYFTDQTYGGFLGSYLKGMENKELKWQKKLDYNVGVDVDIKRVLSLKFDYYVSITDNTLIDFSLPPSVGFSSVKENMGKIKNTGVEARINWTVFSHPKEGSFLTVNASVAHNENKIMKISDALKSYNKEQDEVANDRFKNKPVLKYYEGMSMNAIWAVRSLGIDPANGREIYLDKNGNPTYGYSASNQVVCGDGLPKVQGNFGINAEHKGLGLNLVFRYQVGAKMYNQTLVDRVENVDMNYNVDRRVLTGRWQKPGDVKPFKSLAKVWVAEEGIYKMEKTQATSRFVQKRNELDLASVNVYYDFNRFQSIKTLGLERLRLSFYMNDVFKVSSIRTERGLYYPFARSCNFSLQVTF